MARRQLEPGDRVRIIPNHSCVVSNLVDQAWMVEGNVAVALPIAARGKNYLAQIFGFNIGKIFSRSSAGRGMT